MALHSWFTTRWAIFCSQATIASITELQAAAGVTDESLLNFVVSDGATLVATRFASENTQACTLIN